FANRGTLNTERPKSRAPVAPYYSISSACISKDRTTMTISDQIYRIEEDYSLPRDYMLCIHFFLDSLNTAPNALPEHILHELRHAQSFWQTGNSGYTLASGKKRVWEAINE